MNLRVLGILCVLVQCWALDKVLCPARGARLITNDGAYNYAAVVVTPSPTSRAKQSA
jgi:hypothetical protein